MNTAVFSSDELAKAAALLQKGEIVAFPTETVYGLGAAIFQPLAIKKIFTAKKRPSDNPLIAHLCELSQVEALAIDIPKQFFLLAESFFPGPLTLVLKKHESVPAIVSGGLSTIALRMPAHEIASTLIRLVGEPLVAPSANLSGRPSSTTAQHVLEDFSGSIAGVIDGGATQLGLESTVVSLLDPTRPVLLRPGAVSLAALENVLKQKVSVASKKMQLDQSVVSPGMKYRHYAPKMPIRVFTNWEVLIGYVETNKNLKRLLLANQPLGNMDRAALTPSALYASLRYADENSYEEIVAFCDPLVLSNPALLDRLSRASSS
jgi:L-threonylcarbamoyladenylate synthase